MECTNPGASALALILALAMVGCGAPPPDRPAERVILIGVDGLDPRVIERLRGERRLPNIARFIDRGVSGEIETLLPTYSPILWATIATGKLPPKHGILGFGKKDADGELVPFTSNSRRAKALWNILGDAGRSVAVVGWWTTWPAEPVHGVMISDRMLYNRFNIWLGQSRFGEDLPAQTHPPELFAALGDAATVPETLKEEFVERFGAGGAAPEFRESLHDPWYELFLVYARDAAYVRMLGQVADAGTHDFLAYYLNGPDIASHYFWKYMFPEEWDEPIPAEELRAGADVVSRYYEFVDEALGPLLDQADDRSVVVLVSDHGFGTGRRSDSPNISGTHYRSAPPGVIAMAGGSLPRGGKMERAAIVDVAPTILHLMGHPVGRDMDGRVLPIAVGSGDDGARAVEFVATYEDGTRVADGEPLSTGHDEAILEKLRALGYIDSSGDTER